MTTKRIAKPSLPELERSRLAQLRRRYRIARAQWGHTVHESATHLGVTRQHVDDVLKGKRHSVTMTASLREYCDTAPTTEDTTHA